MRDYRVCVYFLDSIRMCNELDYWLLNSTCTATIYYKCPEFYLIKLYHIADINCPTNQKFDDLLHVLTTKDIVIAYFRNNVMSYKQVYKPVVFLEHESKA